MAKSTPLEELQCLAFAYFALVPYSLDPEHEKNWLDEFSTYIMAEDIVLRFEKDPEKTITKGTRITEDVVDEINKSKRYSKESYSLKIFTRNHQAAVHRVQEMYGRFLSDKFNFARLLSENGYAVKITKRKDTGNFTYVKHPKTRRSYVSATAFVRSPIIPSNLSGYVFLDQNSAFTNTVKDESLARLKKILSLSGSAELLSPVDVFFVRRSEELTIIQEFRQHIINASDDQILANMSFGTTGKNTYRTIMGRHFADRSMIGVSLKSASTIDAPTNIKIIGTVLGHNSSGDKDLLNFVDPYGKLIGQMMTKDADVGKLIDKAITIKFDNFVIDSNRVSWEYPVTFNYDDMIDNKTHEPLYHIKLHFELLTWTDTGFNGWWKIGGKQKSPWVSGVAVGPAEKMFHRYHEYSPIIKELVKIRTEVFKELVPPPSVLIKDKIYYDAALRELGKEQILRAASSSTSSQRGGINTIHTHRFFKTRREGPSIQDYYLEVVKRLTMGMTTNISYNTKTFSKGSKKEGTLQIIPALNAHFTASQLAFFLFRGGKTHGLLLKKRIFLSLFGLLTKSGYKIFEGNAGKVEMTNYIRKLFIQNGKQVEAYYSAAPYVLLT